LTVLAAADVQCAKKQNRVYTSPMQSKAATVKEYLSELPEDRRIALAAVRKVIIENLDKDYAEGMSYGMIGYVVPHSIYPPGYHCNPKLPLPFAVLGSQKNYMSVHLMSLYYGGDEGIPAAGHLRRLQEAWAKTGKKLDMGKSCIRFKRVEDLALDVLGEAVKRVPVKEYIRLVEAARAATEARPVKGPPKKVGKKVAKKAGKATKKAKRARG